MTIDDIRQGSGFLQGICLRDLLEEYAIRRGDSPETALKAYASVYKSLYYIPQAIADKTYAYRKLFREQPSKEATERIVREVAKDESIDFSTALKRSSEALGLPEGLLQGLIGQFLVSCEPLAPYFYDVDQLMLRFGFDPEGGYQDYLERINDDEWRMISFEDVIQKNNVWEI